MNLFWEMCWLWKEPLWSRRFEQYTLLVFRRMLDCWWCWGLSRAGGMHIWAGRIQVVLDRWCVGVAAGWMCVRWSVSVLWWAADGRVGLSSGDQMSLMKKPMSCGTVLCDLISMASLTLRWCQNWTGAMRLVSFQLMRWSCSWVFDDGWFIEVS